MKKLVDRVCSGIMVVSFLLAINNLHVPNMALAMESIKNVVTESDKEVEFAKPATPEQQKEIANDLYDAVKEYWDKRDIDWHTANESLNSDLINAAYEKFLDGEVHTYGMKLELDEKLYQEALNDPKKNWDCKVLTGHVANYLRKLGIKHRCISFKKNHFSSTCIIYAVSENNDENWYALDMDVMRKTELALRENKTSQLSWLYSDEVYGGKSPVYHPLESPIDAARIPLEVYADNLAFGFGGTSDVFVYGDNKDAIFQGKLFAVSGAPLIGEWVNKNCTKNFRNKFLVVDVSHEYMMLDSGKMRVDVEHLDKISRRLFVEEKSIKPDTYRVFGLWFRIGNENLKVAHGSKWLSLKSGLSEQGLEFLANIFLHTPSAFTIDYVQ